MVFVFVFLQVSALETAEAVLKTQHQNLESSLKQKEMTEKDLRALVEKHQESEHVLKTKLLEMEKTNLLLQTRVSDIESHNQGLMEAVKAATQSSSETHLHIGDGPVVASVSGDAELVEEIILPENRPPQMATLRALTRTEDLQEMSKEELVSRIQELEELEKYQHDKITELTENLNHLRQEVECVAVSMEVENKVPSGKKSPVRYLFHLLNFLKELPPFLLLCVLWDFLALFSRI